MYPDTRMFRGSVEVEAYDPDGTLVTAVEEGMNDWLDQFYLFQRILFHDDTTVSITDITGNNFDFRTGDGIGPWNPTNQRTEIVVGSNDTPFSQSDVSLSNTISSSDVSASNVDLPKRTVRFSTSFSFGSSTDVRETGIRWRNVQDSANNSPTILIERTVLESTVTVPGGGSLSITYRLEWP